MNESDIRLARKVATVASPLHGGADEYDRLIDAVGDATLVLIGEASHGTRDFYRERAQITKRLIVEKLSWPIASSEATCARPSVMRRAGSRGRARRGPGVR